MQSLRVHVYATQVTALAPPGLCDELYYYCTGTAGPHIDSCLSQSATCRAYAPQAYPDYKAFFHSPASSLLWLCPLPVF
jgi:hypothetical protein